jgi:hypothetical protein
VMATTDNCRKFGHERHLFDGATDGYAHGAT